MKEAEKKTAKKAPAKKTSKPKTEVKKVTKKVVKKPEKKIEIKPVETPVIKPVKKEEVQEVKKVEAVEPKKTVKKEKEQGFKLTRREKVLIGLVILTSLATGIMYYLMFGAKYYSFKASWGLNLPGSLKEEYSVKGKKDEFGDYNTYYVFSYEDEEDVADIVKWTDKQDTTVQYSDYQEAMKEWCNVLGISKDNRPVYTDVTYWYKHDNYSDEIIMVKNKKEKKIYLAEYFQKEEK